MFGKLLKPFVTSAASGVSTRYLTVIASTAVTVLGILGFLDDAQVEALKGAVPELLTALAALVAAAVPVYAAITKSHSDKAAGAAKAIDQKIHPGADVVIKTPAGVKDIVIPDKSGK